MFRVDILARAQIVDTANAVIDEIAREVIADEFGGEAGVLVLAQTLDFG